uniref:ubiquitinyl hydrolase 1 n=1 Tax=Callorhinchus milii TaxID=7868 RepID=A0A4W3K0H6_CALMI
KMANVTESGRRRLGRNQEEATSKKKLKDKVNQENKEGKNAVSSEPKKDLFSEWKQNADEVIVKLKLGEGAVKVDDIDAAFTDTDCVVTLPDGRQWSCQFHEEIESSCSKVQYKEKGNILQLLVQKKIPLHTWPSLWKKTKADRGVKRAINLKTPEKNDCLPEPGVKRTILYKAPEEPRLVPETVAEQKIVDEPNKETDIASQERGAKCAAPGKSAETESSANNPDERLAAGAFESKGKRDGRGPQGDGHMAEKRNGTGQSSSERAEVILIRSALNTLRFKSHDSNTLVFENIFKKKSNLPSPEHYVNLSFVKYDSYEKGTDSMVVHVYVKEICKSTSKVLFREQDFTLIFQTRHNVFLRLHPGCGPNTIFKWQVKVRNLLNPEQCMYTFTASRIDICLKKRQNQRWGGLEALAAQGAVGGAKVAVPAGPPSLDKAQPGSSQHALPPKEEPRPSDKEKVRSEEASLDSVAVRQTIAHSSNIPEVHPKPTCMVTPMTHSLASGEQAEEEEEEKKVCLPGFTGLVNLGNTCFMNSVIQSLSNTRELRDYFHDRSFETEINYNNPLGTGGRLAIGFAVLLQALWKGTHHAYQPSKLKAIVASKASQFTGYAQHDAQEFMAFLLDGLHEDLNRIQNKPYTETVDSDGRLDEVVAEEAWDRHKMRNDSFIVDLFQGQYKSKLVCPVCYKVSITFDPFLYLPVPLPQKQKVLTVYFFAKEPHKKPVKILVSVSKENSNASDVLDAISRNLKVKVETLRLTEVVRNRFHRIFEPCQSLENTSPSDTLLCFEVLTKELAKEQVVELQVQQRLMVPKIPINKCAACHKPQQPDEKLRRCTSCYRVAYCNQTCQVNHWTDHKNQCRPENIGYPFLISVPKSRLTFSRLTQLLEGYSRYSVNVFQPPFQAGRITPEPPPSKPDAPPLVSANVSSAETGEKKLPPTAEVQERDFKPVRHAHLTGSASEPLLTSAFTKELNMPAKDRDSVHSYDSGFSESRTESPKYVAILAPSLTVLSFTAAVPGYQQRAESARSHTSQFHIKFIDSSRKEEKVDDKGDMPLEFPDCVSLAMIWKNNERQKEYVLVESRELEYMEDPCSASDAARAGYFTLEQCLNLFTKPEVLAPEEAWYCPKCKQHREASKQLMLWRLPNVLIIQLKRFSFRNFIWRDKINDMVEFPIRNLDLSKFCIGQKDDRQQPIYDLYAVINHYGGMIGGHYTAYARLPSDKNSQRSDVGWRLFDDSTVTTVDESQVAARHAYVLFYRRRNSPVVRPVRTRAGGRGAECATGAEGASTQVRRVVLRNADTSLFPAQPLH